MFVSFRSWDRFSQSFVAKFACKMQILSPFFSFSFFQSHNVVLAMNCLRSCLGAGEKAEDFKVKVVLLDKQEIVREVRDKTTGQDLLKSVFAHIDLAETAYFGLRFQDAANQTHWLDPAKRVKKQLKAKDDIALYLGVKFYAADPCRLVEEITRYQFFLQLKLDVLQGRLPVSRELAVELSAYALQCE